MSPGGFRCFFISAALLFAAQARAEWMDWSTAVGGELDADDNVNIATSGNEREDESLTLALRTGRSYMLESSPYSNARLGWKLDLSRRNYNTYSDLTYTLAGGSVLYRHKFGLGTAAARLSLAGSGHVRQVRDANRDAAYYVASLGLEKRLGPRFDLGAHGYYRWREGESWTSVAQGIDSNVYDSEHFELAVAGHYSLLPRLRFSARASYFDGEFDSDCGDLLEPGGSGRYGGGLANLGKEPDYDSYAVKAIAVDEVFGCRWLADGDGYGASAEFNWSISRLSSLRLRAAYREIKLDAYEDYSNSMLNFSYRRHF
jgi:hypothetical protein